MTRLEGLKEKGKKGKELVGCGKERGGTPRRDRYLNDRVWGGVHWAWNKAPLLGQLFYREELISSFSHSFFVPISFLSPAFLEASPSVSFSFVSVFVALLRPQPSTWGPSEGKRAASDTSFHDFATLVFTNEMYGRVFPAISPTRSRC